MSETESQFAHYIELPEELPAPVSYVMTRRGCFEIRETPLGYVVLRASRKIEGLQTELDEGIKLAIPKIPGWVLTTILDFFRAVYKHRGGAEAFVQIFYNKDEDRFFLFCPKQSVSRASVTFERDPKLEAENILVMDIHSHNSMPAFFSGIDDADEKEDRLYGVIGYLHRPVPQFKFRMGMAGRFVNLDGPSIFGPPEEPREWPKEWLELCCQAVVWRHSNWRKRFTRSRDDRGPITPPPPGPNTESHGNPVMEAMNAMAAMDHMARDPRAREDAWGARAEKSESSEPIGSRMYGEDRVEEVEFDEHGEVLNIEIERFGDIEIEFEDDFDNEGFGDEFEDDEFEDDGEFDGEFAVDGFETDEFEAEFADEFDGEFADEFEDFTEGELVDLQDVEEGDEFSLGRVGDNEEDKSWGPEWEKIFVKVGDVESLEEPSWVWRRRKLWGKDKDEQKGDEKGQESPKGAKGSTPREPSSKELESIAQETLEAMSKKKTEPES